MFYRRHLSAYIPALRLISLFDQIEFFSLLAKIRFFTRTAQGGPTPAAVPPTHPRPLVKLGTVDDTTAARATSAAPCHRDHLVKRPGPAQTPRSPRHERARQLRRLPGPSDHREPHRHPDSHTGRYGMRPAAVQPPFRNGFDGYVSTREGRGNGRAVGEVAARVNASGLGRARPGRILSSSCRAAVPFRAELSGLGQVTFFRTLTPHATSSPSRQISARRPPRTRSKPSSVQGR